MNFADLKGKHAGETIIVCGCGNTASNVGEFIGKYKIIGVNDIQRLITPDYLVVLNDEPSFNQDRWHWVVNTQAEHVFTHIRSLAVPEEKKVIIKLGKHGVVELDKEAIDYTSNSPFVACIIAYHLGARKRIGMIGCDFTPHHFFKKTGEHLLTRRINTIKDEYKRLTFALSERGVQLFSMSPGNRTGVPFVQLT